MNCEWFFNFVTFEVVGSNLNLVVFPCDELCDEVSPLKLFGHVSVRPWRVVVSEEAVPYDVTKNFAILSLFRRRGPLYHDLRLRPGEKSYVCTYSMMVSFLLAMTPNYSSFETRGWPPVYAQTYKSVQYNRGFFGYFLANKLKWSCQFEFFWEFASIFSSSPRSLLLYVG